MILFGVVLVPANLVYAATDANPLLDEEEMPLPGKTKELLSTCPDIWKDLFTSSSTKNQFMDEITKSLISNTPEFQSLNGNIQSITAQYEQNSDSPCPPWAYANGVFRSENNNDFHRFVLEFNGVYFRYMINGMHPQYALLSVQDEKQNEFPTLPPLKQILSGTSPQDIVCSKGLHLVFTLSEKPACVKEQSISKLINRGWIDESKKQSPSLQKISTDPFLAKKITETSNQFALDFYKEESKEKDKNIFFSSPSISTAFSILYEGARGETADEMQKVFGFPKDDDERRAGFFSFGDMIDQKNDDKNTIQMANALWLANGFEPLPEYVNTAKTYYSSSVDTVNFSNDEGRLEINDWAKSKTQDRIEELLVPGSIHPSLTKMVITNAIYFQGVWEHPFDSEDTYEADFAVDSDKTVKVQMMTYPHKMAINHTSTEQMQILQMPYKGKSLSMLIILPHKADDMQSVEQSITLKNLNLWKSKFYDRGTVIHIPKFTLKTEYDLKESLTDMGMPSVFGPADLSGITGSSGLFVSKAVHKAFVTVNEKGTEAAAATAIVTDESGGQEFRADHPFIFIIQDNETESILFMGKVMDPTV